MSYSQGGVSVEIISCMHDLSIQKAMANELRQNIGGGLENYEKKRGGDLPGKSEVPDLNQQVAS